ncbi:unnamed protein product [Phaeothamnion confervicola]
MCGIIMSILANRDAAVNQELYDGLTMLQHRGQDAAGMVVGDKNRRMHVHKECGLVRDVFKLQQMIKLLGFYGIGHCRYPTAGASANVHEAQPFVTNIPFGLCIAHNGNLTNTMELQQELCHRYHFNTDSDSELMLSVLADELLNQPGNGRPGLPQQQQNGHGSNGQAAAGATGPGLDHRSIFAAVRGLMRRARGGYAGVLMVNGYGIMAFRDPNGIRPLCFGKRASMEVPGKFDFIAASESVAIDSLGYRLERDVSPGEAVWFGLDGTVVAEMCHPKPILSPCVFEYVYFGRPDSVIDGVSVYRARQQMGNFLADRIRREHDISTIDVVCPVPDTSRVSALQCALRLGLPYEEGLTKNRYIARTFIMPGQQKRKKNVRKKLNPIRGVFAGKRVLLIDDSIVRGTTSTQIIDMCREAGAAKVYFCSASPPVRYPNVYGIDMPVQSELIAFGRDEAEIARELGADWVVYSDMADMEVSVREQNPAIDRLDCSCFCGEYVTGDIDDAYFARLRASRGDAALIAKNAAINAGGGGEDVDQLVAEFGDISVSAKTAGKEAVGAGRPAATASPWAGAAAAAAAAPVAPAAAAAAAAGSMPTQPPLGINGTKDGVAPAAAGAAAGEVDGEPAALPSPSRAAAAAALQRPRGRQIAGVNKGAATHASNEDFRRLQDRFSGWS